MRNRKRNARIQRPRGRRKFGRSSEYRDEAAVMVKDGAGDVDQPSDHSDNCRSQGENLDYTLRKTKDQRNILF